MMATAAAGEGLGAEIVSADPKNWGFAATSSTTAIGQILFLSFGFDTGGSIAIVSPAGDDELGWDLCVSNFVSHKIRNESK